MGATSHGGPQLTKVVPWVVGAVLIGAGVITVARRPPALRITTFCDALNECEVACRSGVPSACARVGDAYRLGRGVARDPVKAVSIWTESCDVRGGSACAQLIEAMEEALPGTEALAISADELKRRAMAGWERGCETGDDVSCTIFRNALMRWSDPPDERTIEELRARLHEFWGERCAEGSAIACFRRGDLTRDDASMPDLRESCRLGHGPACLAAAQRLPLDADKEDVHALNVLACDHGEVDGCIAGGDVAPDASARSALLERATVMLAKSCRADYADACGRAAKLFMGKALVTPADESSARELKALEIGLRKTGCEQKALEDCLLVAETFRAGTLVARDMVQAELYKQHACDLGFSAACEARRDVLGDVIDASIGYHTCVVKGDGTVWCWGQNREGQLGDGTKTDRDRPVQAQGVANAVAVDIYGATTCIRTSEDQAWCWGGGFDGVERVDGDQATVEVATGYEHVCALRSNGDVGCSGDEPENHPLGASALRVSGMTHCAIASSKLWCWGGVMQDFFLKPTVVYDGKVTDAALTSEGMCVVFEDGSATCRAQPLEAEPMREVKLDRVRLIGGDADSGCAMRGDELWCWYLREGELKAPFLVKAMPGVRKLIVSSYEGCAVRNDGELACWYMVNPEPEAVSFQLPPG